MCRVSAPEGTEKDPIDATKGAFKKKIASGMRSAVTKKKSLPQTKLARPAGGKYLSEKSTLFFKHTYNK